MSERLTLNAWANKICEAINNKGSHYVAMEFESGACTVRVSYIDGSSTIIDIDDSDIEEQVNAAIGLCNRFNRLEDAMRLEFGGRCNRLYEQLRESGDLLRERMINLTLISLLVVLAAVFFYFH